MVEWKWWNTSKHPGKFARLGGKLLKDDHDDETFDLLQEMNYDASNFYLLLGLLLVAKVELRNCS
ncbi:hypothetical protein C5167_029622 [Papaver somniferum]|uniref:Uncharacterized protein n=1 Tax=Papaver somniferum TaxID=3469 RepID=A0A4Y7JSZ8_PAPSO|nr:hypothetical protein C5167_024948 [Papaver somniferum]RZC90487.1 hypothetical protein C5167_029622 [Papaver somniferum]